MSINLYRVSAVTWAVTVDSLPYAEPQLFTSVEAAADFLESQGVLDNEIDIALAEMVSRGHTRAQFGIQGRFIFTDGANLHGSIGAA